MKTAVLQELLEEGARQDVFPWARAEVWHLGRLHFTGGVGTQDVRFDLASLTKILSTGALFASLWAEGKISPETRLAQLLPESVLSDVDLEDLLTHRSGLPAFSPFFADVLRRWPELLQPQCPPALRHSARAQVVEAAVRLPADGPRGSVALYSDAGFILLGEALARAGEAPLDRLFAQRVAQPLGLTTHFRPLTDPPPEHALLAPTGARRPREPAPGQQNTWSDVPSQPSRAGQVDDDNAWAMNGVAGHAGLFGTTHDVARFGVAVLEELSGKARIAPAALWERMVTRDTRTRGSSRALAFDTPSRVGSSAGHLIGGMPPGAFGHLGFTGTSLWVDRARQLVVALCTNRTWLGRAEVRIVDFRPRFHDAVVQSLAL